MHQYRFLKMVFLGLLLSAGQLHAEVVELLPVQDNTLYEDAEGDVSNGAGKYLFLGKVGPDGDELLRRALVQFDLSAIPPNALINSVSVSFVINQVPQGSPSADSASLQRVTSAWGEAGSNPFGAEGQGAPAQEGDATWLHTIYSGTTWDSPGGDYASLMSATAAFGTSNPETLTFASTPELIEDVRSWIVNPDTNHGWILRGDEIRSKNARRVASRECPSDQNCFEDPPKLTIDYTVPSVVDHLLLTEVTSELTNPVGVKNAGDGSNRLFIVEQEGLIRIYDTETDSLFETPFLDIQDEVFSLQDSGGNNEQGLLGLAFHPDYASNGLFYVNYTISPSNNVWHTVVAEFMVSGDPDVAGDGNVIMEFAQDARNHNGGDLHFGEDGFLYIATGDGGGSNDQFGNAQDIDNLKGGLLRIDVDSAAPEGAELCGIVSDYGIPTGNAFPEANDGCDEILHYGLRNPWRFSFDAKTGDLWIADVGQNLMEEVNYLPADTAGQNFGWPCREGTTVFNQNAECPPPLTDPVFEYSHNDGDECSVTGGYVYRGSTLPITGSYVYGDWCTHRIWIATLSQTGWSSVEWEAAASSLNSLSSFGQDEQCELYVADRNAGAVFRIDESERLFSDGYEARRCR
jgi:glucose/arabinose dehydrogenase